MRYAENLPLLTLVTTLSIIVIYCNALRHAVADTGSDQDSMTVSLYKNRIVELEADTGPYHHALGEALISLGRALAAQKDFKEAFDVFARALHINRINTGLHNIGQVPMLEHLIETSMSMQDWQLAADYQDYLLWIYKRNHNTDSTELLPVLNRVAWWYLEAHDHTRRPDSIIFLVKAANLFSQMVDIIEANHGMSDPEQIAPLYGIANANFKFVEPYGFIRNSDPFFGRVAINYMPVDFSAGRNTVPAPRDIELLANILEEEGNAAVLIGDSYRSGKNALQRIIEIHELNDNLSGLSHAYALTHLGDWYLRFNRRHRAIEYYQAAYTRLLESGDGNSETIERLFGSPRSLDVLGVPVAYRSLTAAGPVIPPEILPESPKREPGNRQFVIVDFDVNEFGSVKNFEILESNPPENMSFRRMAKSRITRTPFRPRLQDGKPVATTDIRIVYRFD